MIDKFSAALMVILIGILFACIVTLGFYSTAYMSERDKAESELLEQRQNTSQMRTDLSDAEETIDQCAVKAQLYRLSLESLSDFANDVLMYGYSDNDLIEATANLEAADAILCEVTR